MDGFLIVAAILLLLVAIVLSVCLVNSNAAVREANKREEIRQDFFKREGMHVYAKVTRVMLQKDLKQYDVFATWYSRETGKTYNFQETCVFPKSARQGFQPNISKGDTISVWIIFSQPTYYVEQSW